MSAFQALFMDVSLSLVTLILRKEEQWTQMLVIKLRNCGLLNEAGIGLFGAIRVRVGITRVSCFVLLFSLSVCPRNRVISFSRFTIVMNELCRQGCISTDVKYRYHDIHPSCEVIVPWPLMMFEHHCCIPASSRNHRSNDEIECWD
jgi:hypothetical protein